MLPTWQVVCGDVLEQLRLRATGSVQCIVTSPPYWGLRNYGIDGSIWGGKPHCAHEWGDEMPRRAQPPQRNLNAMKDRYAPRTHPRTGDRDALGLVPRPATAGTFCQRCGAWYGAFGNEPTPDLYIQHAVLIFREARRVLRDDGTLWLNIGDTYANDGKWGGETQGKQAYLDDVNRKRVGREKRRAGLKAKDLCLIPFEVARALRDDGWYLRADCIWSKPNPLPESITDRPTKSHEYVFLLAKSERYYYDIHAVKEQASPHTHARGSSAALLAEVARRDEAGKTTGGTVGLNPKAKNNSGVDHRRHGFNERWKVKQNESFSTATALPTSTRNRRSVLEFPHHYGEAFSYISDLLDQFEIAGVPIETIRAIAERCWERNPMAHAMGALLNTVWGIPTQPYAEAHFATFPQALPAVCIQAGTSAHGACPSCAAPYRRIVGKGAPRLDQQQACGGNADGRYSGQATKPFEGTGAQNASDVKRRILDGMHERITVGWQPTCGCAIGCPDEPDALEVIQTQLGEDGSQDPTTETGRGGFNRPRLDDQGVRPMTRFEQRRYAEQLRRSPFRQSMKQKAGGEAFRHYCRTDRSGARPIPPDLLEEWIAAGWLTRIEAPTPTPLEPVPCVVMDMFNGSGTSGVVAVGLGRSYVGLELKPDYVRMSRARIGHVAPLMSTEVPS